MSASWVWFLVRTVLLVPFRFIYFLFTWRRYWSYYDQARKKFPEGAVIRNIFIPENERCVHKLSPDVQELFYPHDLGVADEEGDRELYRRDHATGSVIWSFFEAYEPWVVEKIEVQPFFDWVGQELLKVEGHPITCVIRPYFPNSIIWHYDEGSYGRDRIPISADTIEEFPENELLERVKLGKPLKRE